MDEHDFARIMETARLLAQQTEISYQKKDYEIAKGCAAANKLLTRLINGFLSGAYTKEESE